MINTDATRRIEQLESEYEDKWGKCAFTKFHLIPPLDKEVNIQVIDMDNGKKEYVTNTTQLFNILSSYFSEWGSLDMLYDNYNITTNGVKYSLDLKDNMVLVSGLSRVGKK